MACCFIIINENAILNARSFHIALCFRAHSTQQEENVNCVVKFFGYSLDTHTGPAAVQQATTAALLAASSESLNDVRNIFLFFFYPNMAVSTIVLVLIKLKVFFSANLF